MQAEMNMPVQLPERKKRTFTDKGFEPNTWEEIAPYFKNLQERELSSLATLEQWLADWSELETVLGERSRWIYVHTTTNTADEKAKADLVNLYTNIYPPLTIQQNLLDKKLVACPFAQQLDQNLFYTTIRKTQNALTLFCEQNIPLQSEQQVKQSQFDQISGAQSIVYQAKEFTMQQAVVYLKSNNRTEREEVYQLISQRKLQDTEKLDQLLTELILLRTQIAKNAGFDNYLEYRFKELGRFDYNPSDCLQFHQVIEETLMPLLNQMSEQRQKDLGVDVLKPWDRDVDTSGKAPLRPFETTHELVDKTIQCFNCLDTYFGDCIKIMQQANCLDLDSRMQKGPGGYNISMPESGVPFIFMNAANTEHDLVTMVHEGGHAVHAFIADQLPLYFFKETTSEIAEVASMAMELMSMEHWDIFYANPEELNRAKKNHMQYILSILTRTCLGDSFQFWLYSHPNHTVEERRSKWVELNKKFTQSNIDWSGNQAILETGYQSILHFYVVPFYYIEYAFAQLGSLALWKNFKTDSNKAICDYKYALSLGYTKTIPDFYQTAGVKFDFSKPYVASLVNFLQQELKKLQ